MEINNTWLGYAAGSFSEYLWQGLNSLFDRKTVVVVPVRFSAKHSTALRDFEDILEKPEVWA